MTTDTRLLVFLKGADLVAETAYLALTGKMNYEGELLALKRFDYFRFSVESETPDRTVSSLKDVLARQSTFYNRNKHGYVLESTWDGGKDREGPDIAVLRQRVFDDVSKRVVSKGATDFVGRDAGGRIILKENRIFLIDSLVEERDPATRFSVAGKLQADLGGVPVSVPGIGTLWWMVLSAAGEQEARKAAEGIVVSRRRDRGLLLNPNYQRFEIRSSVEMELTRDV